MQSITRTSRTLLRSCISRRVSRSMHTTRRALSTFTSTTPSLSFSRSSLWSQRTPATRRSTFLRPRTSPLFSVPSRSLFIRTEDTPNPNSLKFLPTGQEVLAPEQGTRDFNSFRAAQGVSPLAADLFQIDGITNVFLGRDFVAVSKEEEADWNLVKTEVFGALTDFFQSGKGVLVEDGDAAAAATASSDAAGTTIYDDDDDVTAFIKELIESKIRPAVQQDGGDIVFRGFNHETGIVSLQLQGSCVGCPSSAVTLKSGIENMLLHYVPEVEAVEEYVDEQLEQVSRDALDDLERRLNEAKKQKQE